MEVDLNIRTIAEELNKRAVNFRVGQLQEIRQRLKPKSRAGPKVFGPQSIQDKYAFHLGGRTELQFNIGLEGSSEIRHGVAFSFETSQSYPNIAERPGPKVRRFNDFVRLYPENYIDMRMWHYSKGDKSEDYSPNLITTELVQQPNIFVFLGKRQNISSIDYDQILEDFDRLLPLYEYAEGDESAEPTVLSVDQPFEFSPGCRPKPSRTTATGLEKQIDISLRHNMLQAALFKKLELDYGKGQVGTENTSGAGMRIDVVVRNDDEYYFYEIKTYSSSRACIRDAIGQLLEYAFWPGTQVASRLVIVGEPELNAEGKEYLQRLKDRFRLPITYQQMKIS